MPVDRPLGNVGGDFGSRQATNAAAGGHFVPSKPPHPQQKAQQPIILPVPLLQGGGAVRTSRQRANTLSSSKVATVPPTLQRLMNHAGGTGGTRGLKHRDKFNNATASLDDGSGRSSSGSDRTSPMHPGKREGDDDIDTHASKRLSPSGPASAGIRDAGFTFSKNGTMPIPQLRIPKQNSSSMQYGLPAHSPTAAMMNSPISRNFQQNAYPQTPTDRSKDKPKLFIRPYGGIEAGPSSARPVMESVHAPYSPQYGGPSSAQPHFAYPNIPPVNHNQGASASLQPYAAAGRARGTSFSNNSHVMSSPLSASFSSHSLPQHMREGGSTFLHTNNIPSDMDIDVVNADGTTSPPNNAWNWGAQGITSLNTSGLSAGKMEASPGTLTLEQQKSFQSWKERGPPSSTSPSSASVNQMQRPWITDSTSSLFKINRLGIKSPVSNASMSPIVKGDGDPGIVNFAGGFDLMEIRSQTVAGDGDEGLSVNSEGFVRARRNSAPRLFSNQEENQE
jgi:hypothetical protein